MHRHLGQAEKSEELVGARLMLERYQLTHILRWVP